MDNKPVTPDNNRDEFDDVLEIMRKRRTKSENPNTVISQNKQQNSTSNKSDTSESPKLKGALANTVIISVNNGENRPSSKFHLQGTSEIVTNSSKNNKSESLTEKTMIHDAVTPKVSQQVTKSPSELPHPSVSVTDTNKTTEVNTIPTVKKTIEHTEESAIPQTSQVQKNSDNLNGKTVEVKVPIVSKPSINQNNATKVDSLPVQKPKNTELPVSMTEKSQQISGSSAVSLDDFSQTSNTKRISYDNDKVKVTFLGSVWFGIIKIILYLVFVLGISSAIAGTIIYVANDIFAFVKESEITADIPVNANTIEITSILNQSNIINQSNETVLYVNVLKNNSLKLADVLNTTDVLQPLKDAGITKISVNDNTSFTITVPANIDISVISQLLDTVNATEVKTDLQIDINIPENATTKDIGIILKEAGVIKYSNIFKMYANYRIDKRSYLTGEYIPGKHTVNPTMNYDKLLDALSAYERDVSGTVRITIPEGLTVNETIDLLVEKGVRKKTDYIEALQNFTYDYPFATNLTTDKISEHRFNTDISYRLEGYLFPDTYDFYYNENPISVIDKLLTNFNNKFEEEYYTRAAELGLTVDEIITIASMIEKEGNNPADYYYISSVFHNRLNSSEYPFLNSDATLQYALSERSDLYNIDTNMDHPYNTYKYRGLPPGAICNPGIQAIDAALYPEKTNYFYFYTKKNGETVFTRTYEEHQRIVSADKSN